MTDERTQELGSGASSAHSQGESKAASKKKVSLVKILVLLIVVLIVLGGIAVGVLYLLSNMQAEGSSDDKPAASQTPTSEGPATSAAPSKDIGTVEMKPFIVNLAGEGGYLKTTIALGYGVVEQDKLLEERMTQVRDAILTILSSKSAKTISTKHGKLKLKEDIKKALNEIPELRDVITSVYFTDFQIL